MADYEIKKKITGGYSVKFNCPHCGASLVADLKEAGTTEQCPSCQQPFVVPGEREAAEIARKEREAAEAKRQQQKKAQEAKEKKQWEQAAADLAAANAKKQEQQAKTAADQRKAAQHSMWLFGQRRQVALSDDRHSGYMPFWLSVAQAVILAGAAFDLIMALLATITVIGIPFAIGCVISFVMLLGLHSLINMANEVRNNSASMVEHLRFQSSVLDAIYDELRK